jgi:protoporphyrinogen oxidase
MSKPRAIILGAGPAGLGAAYKLAKEGLADVTVLERNQRVGGNAGSFELSGQRVDFGSHRLHPASDPEILNDIRALLGDDLLTRPRHGRILLQGRWIHFPLKPLDLALRLPPSFAVGVMSNTITQPFMRNGSAGDQATFASVMEKGLGSTICREFYFPYARKIWGLAPEQLSATQAYRRVANNSIGKMFAKLLNALPVGKSGKGSHFFYPRRGFGQISEAYAQAAQQAGAEILFESSVKAIEMRTDGDHQVAFENRGQSKTLQADFIWSTIPITALAKILTPVVPIEYLEAAQEIDYRAMILVYLVLEQDRFSPYDAHYFPGENIKITRLSEPKNYSGGHGPSDQTVLCAELPCAPEDAVWSMSNEELGELVSGALSSAGIPIQAPIAQVQARRLRYAYPIYQQGYEVFFEKLDAWISQFDDLLSFGRQGLFAHDNTHHALFMAYSAVSCLNEAGEFDHNRWQDFRRVFETHVVED